MYRMQQLGYPAPSLPHGLCGNALVKGQSKRFLTSSFFHHSNQPGPLTNVINDFRFWLSFCWVIQIFLNLPGLSFSFESFSPGKSYCAESISLGYLTPASHLLKYVLKSPQVRYPAIPSPRGIILCRINLPGVSYPRESIKIHQNVTPRGKIPRRVSARSS